MRTVIPIDCGQRSGDRGQRLRTREGRERAKGRGVRFGRPLKLSPHQRREAIERLDAGDAVVDVARSFGVDRATLYRLRAEAAQ
jgi:DNA invertase Pin-like site-specific DNA recombinase